MDNDRVRSAAVVAATVGGVALVAVVATMVGGDRAPAPAPATEATSPSAPTTSSPPTPTSYSGPVGVAAPGWTCEDLVDDKFACTKDGAVLVLNLRPVEERDGYLDPAKADVLPGVHTFVSDAQGGWFVTVAPTEGVTQEQVDQVGASLVWAP